MMVFQKGHTPWNYRLTKKTDNRLKQASIKNSKTKKRLYKKGELKIWNKNLTKETDERLKQSGIKTSETRKKLFKEGKLKNWSDGLTKETDDRVKKQGESLKGCTAWSKGLTKETDERVKKHSESMKGEKNHFFGKHQKKGTIEKMKIKLSNLLKGTKNPRFRHDITKEKIHDSIKKIIELHNNNIGRVKLRELLCDKLNCDWGTIERRVGNMDTLITESYINLIKNKGRVGINEKQILDEYEKEGGYKIQRDKYANGYYPDGYIKETNTVVEIDELHHFDNKGKLRVEDVLRENKIKEVLGCNFIRIKDLGIPKEQKNLENVEDVS